MPTSMPASASAVIAMRYLKYFYATVLIGAAGMNLGVACAQSFPDKPIRVIVGSAPGGAPDILARAIAQKMTDALGQQVVIDNRAGANGIIGMEMVAKAKSDGYTLLQGFTSALTINPYVYKSLPYDTFRDYAAITQTATNTMVLVANPTLPVRSTKDLVALGKSQIGRAHV